MRVKASRDRPIAQELGDGFEFEALIADLSTRFINLPPDEMDREIEDALRRVCEPLRIDLAVLWQWSDAAPGVISPTHAWCAQEELRPKEPMRQEHYPWFLQQVLAGRMFAISSPEELPAEAAVDRETCRLFGIRSAVFLPLSVGGEPPMGAVGFNAVRESRDWPDQLLKRLQLVAQVFTNALVRRRHEQVLHEREARLEAAADLAGLAFYEMDFGEGVGFVDDRFREICGLPPKRRRASSPWSSGWSICILTTGNA